MDYNPEAAALTGYASVTVRLLARQGKIKSIKRGRDWFLNRSEVLAYIETMRQLGTSSTTPGKKGRKEQRGGVIRPLFYGASKKATFQTFQTFH